MPALKSRTHRPKRGAPHLVPTTDDGPEYAVGYGRISGTERQLEGLSLPRQHGDVLAQIAKGGHLLDSWFEEALSGKRDDRPQYLAALARAEALRREGKRVVVIVARYDRLGRNMAERVRAFDQIHALGAALESKVEGRVPAFVYHVLSALAAEESRLIGARVGEMNDFLESGGWVASRTPNWGYRWRESTEAERAAGAPRRVMDRSDAEWDAAAECWRRAERGDTLRAISQWAAGLPVAARGGRRLSFQAIRAVLQSPVYVGQPGTAYEVANGIDPFDGRPAGRWPALVSRQTWDTVLRRFAQAKRLPRQASGRYLLTGLLRCSKCGGRMVGAQTTQKQKLRDGRLNGRVSTIVRYRCCASNAGALDPEQETSAAAKCTLTIHAASVEADALRQVGDALASVAGLDAALEREVRLAIEELRRKGASEVSPIARERRRLEKERATYNQALGEAGLKLTLHQLDEQVYTATVAVIKGNLERVGAALAALGEDAPAGPPDPPVDDILREVGGWQRSLETDDVDGRREVLAALIDHVVPVRVRVGEYRARVAWTAYGRVLWQMATLAQEAA